MHITCIKLKIGCFFELFISSNQIKLYLSFKKKAIKLMNAYLLFFY